MAGTDRRQFLLRPCLPRAAVPPDYTRRLPDALLNTAEMNALCLRTTQLMDAGGVAVPDLGRAAAPVIENVKQACTQLKLHPGGGQPTYSLMMNVRAYLELSDAIPKPYPFPEAARQQLTEVRETSARLDAHFRALLEQQGCATGRAGYRRSGPLRRRQPQAAASAAGQAEGGVPGRFDHGSVAAERIFSGS